MDLDEKLSPNFTLREMVRSDTAERLAIPNVPSDLHLRRLRELAMELEKVRQFCRNRPLVITSGYRSPTLNRAVGGTRTSHHAMGYAADFHIVGLEPYNVAKAIADGGWRAGLRWDQMILETSRGIVHYSIHPGRRGQVLTQRGGPGTAIEQGIVL